MNTVLKLFFGIVCLLVTLAAGNALAGSRGYYLTFIDISQPLFADGTEVIMALRKSTAIDGRAACWSCERGSGEPGIAILYVKKLPAGVNGTTVKDALVKGGAVLSALRKRIREFSDADGTRLDGLYAYERNAATITIYAIAPQDGIGVATLSLPVKGRVRSAELDVMLEKLAKAFPFVP